MPREGTTIVSFYQGREGEEMNGLRLLRIAGIEPVKALLILSPLLLLLTDCSVTSDGNVRAFNACLVRHAQDAVVCEAPLQAYAVDGPTLAARSLPQTGFGQ